MHSSCKRTSQWLWNLKYNTVYLIKITLIYTQGESTILMHNLQTHLYQRFGNICNNLYVNLTLSNLIFRFVYPFNSTSYVYSSSKYTFIWYHVIIINLNLLKTSVIKKCLLLIVYFHLGATSNERISHPIFYPPFTMMLFIEPVS